MKSAIRGLLLSLAMLAVATDATAANAWKSNYLVYSVVSLNNGGFILLLEASDAACGPSGNQFYVQAGSNGMTADGVKSTLAVVLTALAMGRTVNALVDTTLGGCPVQLAQINP